MNRITPVPVLLLALACAPDSPEAQVRRAFETTVKAIEAGDAGAAAAVLDEGFRGPDGMNKAEARGMLYGWLRRDKVGITVLAQKLEVRGNRATQVVEALLTARSGGALLPEESSRRTFHLRWAQAGKTWKVTEVRAESVF